MEAITLESIISQNTEIVTADMDGETVMMNIETGKYYNLGTMGSIIWGMIAVPLSVESLIGKLLEKYEVGQERCEDEVLSFLGEIYKEGLVKVLETQQPN